MLPLLVRYIEHLQLNFGISDKATNCSKKKVPCQAIQMLACICDIPISLSVHEGSVMKNSACTQKSRH